MDKSTIYLCAVNAYPHEFGDRERKAFSAMHPERPERSRFLYVLALLEEAGYCTVIVFPKAKPPRVSRKREWVTIL